MKTETCINRVTPARTGRGEMGTGMESALEVSPRLGDTQQGSVTSCIHRAPSAGSDVTETSARIKSRRKVPAFAFSKQATHVGHQ